MHWNLAREKNLDLAKKEPILVESGQSIDRHHDIALEDAIVNDRWPTLQLIPRCELALLKNSELSFSPLVM